MIAPAAAHRGIPSRTTASRSRLDMADWEAHETARQSMIPKLSLRAPAARYGEVLR
jgi:hypothetical protein